MILPGVWHKKEVQAANALTDVVVESIHTVLFALISVIAAVVINKNRKRRKKAAEIGTQGER